MQFKELLQRRIMLLDGAIGTQLIAQGARGVLEMLNIDNPEQVEAMHRLYLEAGADIITTNSFCADALSLKESGLADRSYELALAAAKIARAAADGFSSEDKPRLVAGSVGPTTRNLTLATDTTADNIAATYGDVVRGLIEGGVDIILIESAMDVKNISVAIDQVRKIDATIPIVVSAVLSRIVGRVASGATVERFLEQLPLDEIAVVGFNCSGTPSLMEQSLKILCEKSTKPTIFFPSAGHPSLPANQFAKQMEGVMREHRVNIVGGCCGTTPSHIKAMSKVVVRWQPRKVNL